MSNRFDHVRAGLIARGVPAFGEMFLLSASNTSTIGQYARQYFDPDKCYNTFATAEAGMVTGSNDTLLITAEAHSLAAALTIDLNNCNFIGMAPSGLGFAKRARIGMATTFTPMITVSGYGNCFENIYTQHGTAVGDYGSWLISGERNVFNGVHFAGPMVAAQGTSASYTGVTVTGTENVFNDCIFGSTGIGRDQLTANLNLTSKSGEIQQTIFNNCHFYFLAIDTDPYFVKATNADGLITAQFNNCKFHCVSSNNEVKAAVVCTIAGAAPAAVYLSFDLLCEFVNVSLPVVAGSTASVHQATTFPSSADQLNMIAINSAT